jgi:hypothetical protein
MHVAPGPYTTFKPSAIELTVIEAIVGISPVAALSPYANPIEAITVLAFIIPGRS